MKQFWIWILLGGLLTSCGTDMVAMSSSTIRKETRFLTDKMAYELDLSYAQYDDVFEINYDFVSGISYLMEDVVRGYAWAIDEYYYRLDLRNDDLRWVLSGSQYRRFMQLDYFFRPVYLRGPRWSFRVYLIYADRNHFYYPKPHHYRTYRGGHCRHGFDHPSYYRGRHKQPHYTGTFRVSTGSSREASFSADFGSVRIRPNTSVRSTGNSRTSRGSSGSVRSTENSRTSRGSSEASRSGARSSR